MNGDEKRNTGLHRAIYELIKVIKKEHIDPRNGLGEELFLEVASLTPIVNVDLLIIKNKRILMSWRDDEQCGRGWHIPGGCLRLKESLEHRVHLCALNELGTDVICDMKRTFPKPNVKIF